MSDFGGFLRKVVSRPEVSAKKADFAVHIPLEERRSVRPRELAMNRDGSRAGNRRYPPLSLASRFEAANRAMENDELGGVCRVAVAFAIDMLKAALLLDLPDKVFVERNLKLGRQLDFVGLDHLDLNRLNWDLGGLVLLREHREGGENDCTRSKAGTCVQNAVH